MLTRILVALSALCLCTDAAIARDTIEGWWRAPKPAEHAKSSAPDQVMQIRKSGEAFIVELVEHDPFAGDFRAQEYPASVKDGILRIAKRGDELAVVFDIQKGVLVGGICLVPCVRIDEATYQTTKSAALNWKPSMPKIDYGRARK